MNLPTHNLPTPTGLHGVVLKSAGSTFFTPTSISCRSQWPRGPTCLWSYTALTLGSWVRNSLDAWMNVRMFLVNNAWKHVSEFCVKLFSSAVTTRNMVWTLHLEVMSQLETNNIRKFARSISNSMQQSSSWEANSRSASQEISLLLRNRAFITVCTISCQLSLSLSLSWTKWLQCTTSHRTHF